MAAETKDGARDWDCIPTALDLEGSAGAFVGNECAFWVFGIPSVFRLRLEPWEESWRFVVGFGGRGIDGMMLADIRGGVEKLA